jgi:hypothetical protein
MYSLKKAADIDSQSVAGYRALPQSGFVQQVLTE